MAVSANDIQAAALKIIRRQVNSIVASSVADAINRGSTTLDNYKTQLINTTARQCTAPALIVSNYIEGAAPSASVLDARAWFCQQQYDAYVANGSANPALGPYEALGVAFASTAAFSAIVSGRTLPQVIGDAYLHAFSTVPSTSAEQNLVAQYNYFYGLYVGAGVSTTTADLQAKGAVIGQILGYAGTTTGNTLQSKATAWLYNAAGGTETYGAPL